MKTVEAMAALPSVDTQARDRYGRTALDRARVETNGAYDAALAPLLGGKRDAEAGSKTSTGDPSAASPHPIPPLLTRLDARYSLPKARDPHRRGLVHAGPRAPLEA